MLGPLCAAVRDEHFHPPTWKAMPEEMRGGWVDRPASPLRFAIHPASISADQASAKCPGQGQGRGVDFEAG